MVELARLVGRPIIGTGRTEVSRTAGVKGQGSSLLVFNRNTTSGEMSEEV